MIGEEVESSTFLFPTATRKGRNIAVLSRDRMMAFIGRAEYA
jgi:hypothetical protein